MNGGEEGFVSCLWHVFIHPKETTFHPGISHHFCKHTSSMLVCIIRYIDRPILILHSNSIRFSATGALLLTKRSFECTKKGSNGSGNSNGAYNDNENHGRENSRCSSSFFDLTIGCMFEKKLH